MPNTSKEDLAKYAGLVWLDDITALNTTAGLVRDAVVAKDWNLAQTKMGEALALGGKLADSGRTLQNAILKNLNV